MNERIFYCPVDGRVTSTEIGQLLKDSPYVIAELALQCEHCWAWYYRVPKFKAKRTGES